MTMDSAVPVIRSRFSLLHDPPTLRDPVFSVISVDK
jgi:hypothetical protein